MLSTPATVPPATIWAIIDLDGTLCDITHRLHILSEPKKKWAEFHALLVDDIPNLAISIIMRAIRGYGVRIALCTGRPEEYRDETMDWLRKHAIDWDRLLMRPEGNYQSDDLVKPALAADAGLTKDNVLFIMEDRDKMVRMWRQLGFVCFQVQEGAY